MHDLDRTQMEYGDFETSAFDVTGEMGILNEGDELDLAGELLAVTTEDELDQFLGKLIKKVGSTVGKVARGPLGGLLKGVARKVLPLAGGALGTMIPIPGVGTALGGALGTAASKLFEIDLEGLSDEDQEFEIAKRFVRLASTAAANAANAGMAAATPAGAKAALVQAAKAHAPGLLTALLGETNGRGAGAMGGGGSTGRWVRRGRNIILIGA